MTVRKTHYHVIPFCPSYLFNLPLLPPKHFCAAEVMRDYSVLSTKICIKKSEVKFVA